MEIETKPLDTPLEAKALNGKLLAQVSHQTVPLTVKLPGNHQERIRLHVIDCPQTPLVLGIPWLQLHNPHIDWTSGKIIPWSSFFPANCLHSALVPAFTEPPTQPESSDLSNVPKEYHNLAPVFSKQEALSLPSHWPYDCAINLQPGAPLPNSRLYNLSQPESNAMEKYIQDSLAAGIIWPSSSPVGAVFFFIDKKDGTLRPCIDYHGLNNITVKNKYPLRLMTSAFAPLHGATVFTKLDLRNAYHLVRIREGDEWKTAVNTPMGHFEYLVMPFGLTDATTVFEALVNDVLHDMLNKYVFVYLDDILIFSKSLSEHKEHVRSVLQRLLENRLFVKAEKCEFHVPKIPFLGYIVAQGEVQMDPVKVKAVTEWPTPRNRKMLQRFLVFAIFYRRFIRNYSRIAAPLSALTSTASPYCCTAEAETFKELKLHFSYAPILTQPDPTR